jgi:hypothetical protein
MQRWPVLLSVNTSILVQLRLSNNTHSSLGVEFGTKRLHRGHIDHNASYLDGG